MAERVRLEGLDELLSKLDAAQRRDVLRSVVGVVAVRAKRMLARYPPSSEANNPANKRWYERGYGSRYRRNDGRVTGRRTSQTLGRKWAVQMTSATRAVVGNNAAYARYVQGNRQEQAKIHKRRGWVNTGDVAGDKKLRDLAIKTAKSAIERLF